MAQPSNREQLVQGAMECLKTKGYAGTTARDITAASGANLASIGYHFGSKEALLNAALIRILEERNRHVGEIARVTADGSPLGFLTATFNAAAGVFKAPRPLFIAFVEAIAHAQRDDELREQMAAHYHEAIRGIAQALGTTVGGGDPKVMASLLLALFDGLLLQRLLDDGVTVSGEQVLAALVDLAAPAHEQRAGREAPGRGSSRSPTTASRQNAATHRGTPRVPTTTRETPR